jgi:uncharacterized membrane protein YidH (DUF202 family)
MIESQERVEQFKKEIAEMKLRDPATARDRLWLALGIALMAVGVVLAVLAYPLSHSTNNPLSQGDAIALALGGIAVTIAGAALFLRYSLASFMRFWLARLIYEHKAQTDRVLGVNSAEHKVNVS